MEPNPGGPGLWDTYTFTDSTMATANTTTEHLVLDIPSDDGVASDISKVTPSHGEPIVTRSELWSYYCKRRSDSSRSLSNTHYQCTSMAVLCVPSYFII